MWAAVVVLVDEWNGMAWNGMEWHGMAWHGRDEWANG